MRAELEAAESKDKKFVKRKTVLKKIVANITMGNDSKSVLSAFWADAYGTSVGIVSPLFTDVVQCLGTPLLEIKKSEKFAPCSNPSVLIVRTVVYLFLVSYGRQKADQLHLVIPSFLQVRDPCAIFWSWNC